jgi:hypothetical protein
MIDRDLQDGPGMEHFAIALIPASDKESGVKSLKRSLPKAFDREELKWRRKMYWHVANARLIHYEQS